MLIASLESRLEKKAYSLEREKKGMIIMMKEKKAYWMYDRFDKRTNVNYVNVGIYDVDAVDENGFTNAHWEIHAGSVESAIKYVEEHPEEYDVGCNEHLEASPVLFHETAYPMPFEF